jgi:hypothetical protein
VGYHPWGFICEWCTRPIVLGVENISLQEDSASDRRSLLSNSSRSWAKWEAQHVHSCRLLGRKDLLAGAFSCYCILPNDGTTW